MSKTIKLDDIIKIQYNLMGEFEALDSDYPNRASAFQNRNAIKKRLNKITSNVDDQKLIENTIKDSMWELDDGTFTGICEKFRELGWEVI